MVLNWGPFCSLLSPLPGTFGDVWRKFGCHTWGGGVLLVPNGEKPEMLLNILHALDSLPPAPRPKPLLPHQQRITIAGKHPPHIHTIQPSSLTMELLGIRWCDNCCIWTNTCNLHDLVRRTFACPTVQVRRLRLRSEGACLRSKNQRVGTGPLPGSD